MMYRVRRDAPVVHLLVKTKRVENLANGVDHTATTVRRVVLREVLGGEKATVRRLTGSEVLTLSGVNHAVEAIKYALTQTEGKEFLHAWMVGDWEDIRREWPDAPEAVFVPSPTVPKKRKT